MTRHSKDRIIPKNEQDFPFLVRLALPRNGFGATLDLMLGFHRERGIDPRRGRRAQRDHRVYTTWCFADPAHADEFAHQFGVLRLARNEERDDPNDLAATIGSDP
jgi:hypothetical protein